MAYSILRPACLAIAIQTLIASSIQNTHSLDQMIADVTGKHTRMPSLVMSSDGGTGNTSRTRTLSYTRTGNPIPAMDKPGVVFDLLFGKGGGSIAERKQRLQHKQSMLDLIREETKALNRQLGIEDQRQMEEYLRSIREIERRTKRAEDWLLVRRDTVFKRPPDDCSTDGFGNRFIC